MVHHNFRNFTDNSFRFEIFCRLKCNETTYCLFNHKLRSIVTQQLNIVWRNTAHFFIVFKYCMCVWFCMHSCWFFAQQCRAPGPRSQQKTRIPTYNACLLFGLAPWCEAAHHLSSARKLVQLIHYVYVQPAITWISPVFQVFWVVFIEINIATYYTMSSYRHSGSADGRIGTATPLQRFPPPLVRF